MKILEKEMAALVELMTPALNEGKEVAFTVRGNSMWPLLHSGKDKIILQKAAAYKKYDIVFYRRNNGQYVLHRIIGKNKNGFILAGDGECVKEFNISPDCILARAVSGVRWGNPFSCDNKRYKCYSVLWAKAIYLRPALVKIASWCRRWKKK